jgi:hypothetical protein
MAPMRGGVDRYTRSSQDGGFVSLSPDSGFVSSLLQGREPLVGTFLVAEQVYERVPRSAEERRRLLYRDVAGEMTIG